VQAEKFRRRAAICMRFAARVSDPEIALRLKVMASEYLARAEEEAAAATAFASEDTTPTPDLGLPPATEEA
jgi:hypothetical protein